MTTITAEQMAEAMAASIELVPSTTVTAVQPDDGWALPASDNMVSYPAANGPITVRLRISPESSERFGLRTVSVTGALVDATGWVQRDGEHLCLTPSIRASGATVEQLTSEAEAAGRHVCVLIAQALELSAWPVAYTAEQAARDQAVKMARCQLRYALASSLAPWLAEWDAAVARLEGVPERLHADATEPFETRASELASSLGITGDFRAGVAAIVDACQPDIEAALRSLPD